MSILTSCPHCGKDTLVDSKYVGRTGHCFECGQEVTVPGPAKNLPPKPPKQPKSKRFKMVLAGAILLLLLGNGYLVVLSRIVAQKHQCINNLKQLGLSMHNYHDTHKTFPAAAWKDGDGKPKTSWRICILPFIESQSVYEAYDFDQPWDSEHNLEVASRIPPDVFQCPSNPHGSGEDGFQYKEIKGYKIPVSHYVMVTGPNTVGGEGEGTVMSEITDGTSNTIMFVEIRGANAPAWTEPVDITLEELKRGINTQPDSGPGSYHSGGMNAALCDGSVHFLPESIDLEVLEDLATINDGATAIFYE